MEQLMLSKLGVCTLLSLCVTQPVKVVVYSILGLRLTK